MACGLFGRRARQKAHMQRLAFDRVSKGLPLRDSNKFGGRAQKCGDCLAKRLRQGVFDLGGKRSFIR